MSDRRKPRTCFGVFLRRLAMKKTLIMLFLCAICALCMTSCTTNKTDEASYPLVIEANPAASEAVPFPAWYFGEDCAYNDMYAHHSGLLIYARDDSDVTEQVFNLPPELSNGTVIIACSDDYYFMGKKRTVEYELIYFNLYPEKKFADAIPERPIPVEEGEVIGVCYADTGVIIRCNRPDEHLVECARNIPKLVDNNWYFGVESLSSSIAKHLWFKPVTSRTDEITFRSDGLSETLEQITFQSDDVEVPSIYPDEGVRIVTQLSAYPELNTDIRNMSELMVRNQNFYVNGEMMNLDMKIDFDGLTWHIMFPNYFIDYLTDEYTLGDDIYLFANICYSLDGELWLYGRDFQTRDVEEVVGLKMKDFIKANLSYTAQ